MLVQAARNVKILSALTWNPTVGEAFLDAQARGNTVMPAVDYPQLDLGEVRGALQAVADAARSREDPVAQYLCSTAESYVEATLLLEAAGTPALTTHSVSLYGRPDDSLTGGGNTTSLDAARYYLSVADDFHCHEGPETVDAKTVQERIVARLADVFGGEGTAIEVILDPGLASKAAAGASRIRLRTCAQFSPYDVEQLLQHEAFVHTLTARNGRQQKLLQSMSLGAPRTTATQEGLATFSELVTGAIDVARLKRIARRIIATDMALGGADFVEVFRFFRDEGEAERESFNSTARIFRGAPLEGGHAFTKDVVYLHGLMEVHTFFRWAFRHERLDLCEHLMAGRMTLGDTIRLAPAFKSGQLAPPLYRPPWMHHKQTLAGYLAFAVFSDQIALDGLDSDHAFESLDV